MNEKNISHQIQILINQFNTKNFDHVISKCKVLIKKNPQHIILYNIIGSAYQNTGDYINANNSFKNGLKLDPNNFALLNNLAMSYKNLLQYELAEELYLKIINKNKEYVNAYVNLGNLKRDLNKFDDAIKLYEQALKISNQNPIIYYSLALAFQGIGNFDKAISYSKKTLDLDYNFTRADHLISQSKKYKNDSEHYIKLKNKLNNFSPKSFEKIDLYFSLAKAEEDLENIEQCVNYLIKGNRLKKELIKYDVYKEINLIKEIESEFKNANFEEKNKSKEKVIFILGMPRSGTSLIEQIITSHSKVFGGGELPILSNIIKENFIENENLMKKDFQKKIQDHLLLNKLKVDYLKFIENFKYQEEYITDKAPLNFRWIGFIKLLFPNAKIIHCERNPKNNCFSMFKNLFEGGLNFTYDQDDLTKYYKEYSQLMKFWNSKFPNSIYNISYEKLISDSNSEIIEFCELNWEENCLSFHKNKTPIKTMSTSQARQPIYKSSLNTFEKFKDYLKIIDKNL